MFERVSIIGRVGSSPEMKFLPSGIAVTNISVATTETAPKKVGNDEKPCPTGWKSSYNDKRWEITKWWRVTFWRGLAEVANEYLEKGALVFIEGTLNGESADGVMNPRVWNDKDGKPRCSYELTARTMKMLGGKGEGNGSPRQQEPPPQSESYEDELPF